MAQAGAESISDLRIQDIYLAKNSRMDIRDEELAGLMQSIKETGLLQPIGVIKNGKGYEVCFGNRRFLACSKLGHKRIPCIVFKKTTDADVDIKNLTENLQRRNITLIEAGRYMDILQKSGLTSREIAVRLGVNSSYVTDCLRSYQDVPKEFRKDVEVNVSGVRKNVSPGKIALHTATRIKSATKDYKLNDGERDVLYKIAKKEGFSSTRVSEYAQAIKSGSKDPLGAVEPVVAMKVNFTIKRSHHDMLVDKYITNGPFRSLSGFFRAVLTGKKAVRVEVLDRD